MQPTSQRRPSAQSQGNNKDSLPAFLPRPAQPGVLWIRGKTRKVRKSAYHIPGSALLVCKLTPSRADIAMLQFRIPSIGSLLGRELQVFISAVRLREGMSSVSLPTGCLREGMSPVGSLGMSWIFAGSQKSPPPRTPSGPRLALHDAVPSTRPDEAGVTFTRRDTLPAVASGRRYLIDGSLHSSILLTPIVPFFLLSEW